MSFQEKPDPFTNKGPIHSISKNFTPTSRVKIRPDLGCIEASKSQRIKELEKMDSTPVPKLTPQEENPIRFPYDKSLIQEAAKYKTAEAFVEGLGEPVFHGTNEEFDVFEVGRKTGAQGRTSKYGIWFTDNKEEALQYSRLAGKRNYPNQEQYENKIENLIAKAEKAGNKGDWATQDKLYAEAESLDMEMRSIKSKEIIKEAFLPKNMLKYNSETIFNSNEMEKVIIKAKNEGYDGATFINISDSPYGMTKYTNQHIVFNPSMIKNKSQLTDIWNKAHANNILQPEPVK